MTGPDDDGGSTALPGDTSELGNASVGVKRIDIAGPHVPPVDLATVQVATDVTYERYLDSRPLNVGAVEPLTPTEINVRPIEDVNVDGSDSDGHRSLNRDGDYDADGYVSD